MNNFYKTDYMVKYSEVDSNYNMRIDYIISAFQNITGIHSKEIGVDGPTVLEKSNGFWVLTKFKLKIEQLPKNEEIIELETWPTTVSSIRFNRDFAMSKSGKIIVTGISEWCILDYDTNAIRKTSSVCYPHKMPHREERSGAGEFIKLRESVNEEHFIYKYRSSFTDIDSNKHTNNVAYIRIALNTFSPEEYEEINIDEFQISFICQTYFGDEIDVYKKKTENGYYIEGKHNDKTVFNVIIKVKV